MSRPFLPDRLDAGAFHLLFELDWAGTIYRLARERIEATIDGDVLIYQGGLEISPAFEESIDLFSIGLEERSADVTLHMSELADVPDLVSRGHDLGSASGRLLLWVDGETVARTLIEGEIRDPSYGNSDEPIVLTLEEAPWLDRLSIPGPLSFVSAATWLNRDDALDGERYPIILGSPGGGSLAGSVALHVAAVQQVSTILVNTSTIDADYTFSFNGDAFTMTEDGTTTGVNDIAAQLDAFIVGTASIFDLVTVSTIADTLTLTARDPGVSFTLTDSDAKITTATPPTATGNRYLIAEGEIASSSVTLENKANGNTATLAALPFTDLRGNYVTYVDDAANGLFITVGDPIYVRWAGLGVPGVSTAGEAIEWMLARSGLRVDYGRTQAARDLLAEYKIDAYIQAGPDSQISAWDWLSEHILPILPVSIRTGPDGVYPLVWRHQAGRSDAAADLDPSRGNCDRVSAVTYTSRDNIYQEIEILYRRDELNNLQDGRAVLTGDPDTADADTDASMSQYLRESFERYAGSRSDRVSRRSISTAVISDDATAQNVLSWLALRYAQQRRMVTYDCDTSFGHLEPGDLVTVTDAEISWADVPCLIDSIVWTEEAKIVLSLTVQEHEVFRSSP